MALTAFQQELCRELARRRQAGGESYVAGGSALNAITGAPRISRDINLFHDSETALQATWDADRDWLDKTGYRLNVLRERPAYVEAIVARNAESVVVQWMQDSAFRFFPLVSHPDLGLTLHPVDLATNKLLAMAGRLEVRDWVDMVTCHLRVQPLGYLVNAACGKDAGYSPLLILEEAARSSHYSRAEINELDWEERPPELSELAGIWRQGTRDAHEICSLLPLGRLGECVLSLDGRLYRGTPMELAADMAGGRVLFHPGAVRGVWPRLKS